MKGQVLLLCTATQSLIISLLWCVPLVNKLSLTFHSFQDPTVEEGKRKEKDWERKMEEEGKIEEDGWRRVGEEKKYGGGELEKK